MRHLCTRCARLSLLEDGNLQRQVVSQVIRRFSSSIHRRDVSSDTSNSAGLAGQSGRVDRNNTRSRTAPTYQPRFQTAQGQAPRTSSRPAGQLLQRQGPPTGSSGALVRKVVFGGESAQPQGSVLRRTQSPVRTGGAQRQPGKSSPQAGRPPNRRRPRRGMQPDDMDAAGAFDDAAINDYLDPPLNPTESLPYKPKDVTLGELRADWPATPISTTGMVESVQQKFEFLARRIPHGYQTPEALAERYQKGNLIRFESPEEKGRVLELAKDLAAKRADMLTERKSETVEAEDMSFADLATSTEKTALAEKMVRGVYPELEKQRMPFLDTVARSLRNNETYHEGESGKFMNTVRSLMPPPQAGRATPSKQLRQAQKNT